MDKKKNITLKDGTLFNGYPQDMVDRIEQAQLEAYRQILGDPNMTVEQMKEMDARPRPNTINVTFLKKK